MTVVLTTNHGKITIELDAEKAPKSVQNFINYVKSGHYDGTIFHRVIDGFMIQGGGFEPGMKQKPTEDPTDEFHGELQFDRPYILAMANSGPNTNGSQFFITSAPTTWLNRKHTIFGEVKDAASQAVVDKIESTPTGPQDKPVTPVVINSVTIA